MNALALGRPDAFESGSIADLSGTRGWHGLQHFWFAETVPAQLGLPRSPFAGDPQHK